MEKELIYFDKKGYPKIKVYENHFEIKALNHFGFRSFNYSEVKEISHYNPYGKGWKKLYANSSIIGRIFLKDSAWVLKIIKRNGDTWKYNTPNVWNSEFREVFHLIKSKILT